MVVAIGVRPATGFLAGTGIELSEAGALRPDPHGRVADHVWAAGDCCEVRRRIDDAWVFRPLGTHANKHGRALGDTLAGGTWRSTAWSTPPSPASRCGEYLEIARTGLSRGDAEAAGYDPVALVTEGSTASGYMPEADPVALWVMADRTTRRLLGVQVVGGAGPASASTPRRRCCGPAAPSTTWRGWTSPTRRPSRPRGTSCRSPRGGSPSGSESRLRPAR